MLEERAAPEQLQRLYRNRFDEEAHGPRARVWRVLVEELFQKWVGSDDTVLDLGCGYGEFLNHLRCGRRIGVDLNPDSSTYLDPAVEFHQGPVEDLCFLEDASVDVVFTSNVLEHLVSKTVVERALIEARRVLKPGGHLILLGPNMRYLAGEYWDFWDHSVPITDRSLAEALESLGFEIKDHYPRSLPYTTKSHLPQSPALIRLYLRLPLAWGLMGKQFLIRAQLPKASDSKDEGAAGADLAAGTGGKIR